MADDEKKFEEVKEPVEQESEKQTISQEKKIDFKKIFITVKNFVLSLGKKKLITIPEFQRWLQTKGRLLNGNI